MVHSITLQTSDTDIADGDVLGQIGFAASVEAAGSDANLLAASMFARAEGDFSATNNATELVFVTSASEAATPSASNGDLTISSAGNVTLGGKLQTATIGYTDGDTSMTIADGGKVTFSSGFAVGSDAAGDILYYNGTSYVRLGIGSDGQVLTVNDAANAPQWENAAGGGGGETNEFSFKTISVAGQSDVVADTTTDTLTLAAGSNVTITTNASTDTITIAATDTNTQLTEEQVEDFVGGMVTGNTETGISVTYQDGDGTLDFVVSDTTVAGDSGSTGMTPGDTLTIAGGTNATTSMSGDTLTVNVDDAFLVNNANDTTTGTITMANLIIGNAGNIGSASDTDAIAIASDGEVTLSQRTTFSKAIKTPLKDNTDGATITFDLNESSTHKVTLGGNRTLAISNEDFGQKFTITLIQDGTGSRTVNWFGTIQWAGGSAPTLTTTASKADVFGFINVGTFTYYGFVIGQNI